MRLGVSRVLVVGALALAGCGTSEPEWPRTLDVLAVRTEPWSPRATAWLQEHCQLVDADLGGPLGINMDLDVNYRQVLGTGSTLEKALRFSCREEPPWSRVDTDEVANAWKVNAAREGGAFLRCERFGTGRAMDVEILEPGTGARPGAAAVIRVRARHLDTIISPGKSEEVKVFHGRYVGIVGPKSDPLQKENLAQASAPPPNGPLALDRPTVELVNFVGCLTFLGEVAQQLGPGGKAKLKAPNGHWEVELVEIGDEAMLRRRIGI